MLSFIGTPYAAADGPKGECVVLLHGLGRTSDSMSKLERSLLDEGYMVFNKTYPSTEASIEKLSEYVGQGAEYCNENGAHKIHFVTHSLGGILVRFYLSQREVEKLERIVMVTPPNKGSEVAQFFKGLFLYKKLYGPAAQQLGTDTRSLPNRLGPVSAEVGVIAGNLSREPWFSLFIPGPDDGKVSVESTKLAGMKDFIVLSVNHRYAVDSSVVIGQVRHFLKEGTFIRDSEPINPLSGYAQ